MSAATRWIVKNARLALAGWLLLAVVVAWLAGAMHQEVREQAHLDQLLEEAGRRSGEVAAQTVNGHLMGALSLLGMSDAAIKREARGELAPNGDEVRRVLEIVAALPHVDSAFVIGGDGVIRSSLGSGRSSTGGDVRFRPYFQTAMAGRTSVYAAVGTTTGNRTLYFAAPIRENNRPDGRPVGAVVARASLIPVDRLLAAKADVALLLSPQGVVFAATRPEWVGHLAGVATPERVQAIRNLRQFGNMFEQAVPKTLPMTIESGLREIAGRRHAVAGAGVQWNDPAGEWRLVLIDDLELTLPSGERRAMIAFVFFLVLLVGVLAYLILRGRHRQRLATEQLDAYARAQALAVQRKERLAAVGLKLQQARSPETLARVFLSEACSLLDGLQGVVYVADGVDGCLRLAASYACTGDDLPATLGVGEGLLGQCVADGQVQVLTTGSGPLSMIRSGLGEHAAAAVMMAPVRLQQKVLGAVEIARLTPPDDMVRDQFGELLRLLAMNLEIATAVAAPSIPEADA